MNAEGRFLSVSKQPQDADADFFFQDELFDTEDCARVAAHQRSISALTSSVKHKGAQPDMTIEDDRLLRSEWDKELNEGIKMGTSAPVEIPVSKHSWWVNRKPLGSKCEMEEVDVRASTFVAPHLLVDQSGKDGITFSLNNSLAHKRAILKERTEILRMTGFIENAPGKLQSRNSASKTVRSGTRSNVTNIETKASALSRQFGVPK